MWSPLPFHCYPHNHSECLVERHPLPHRKCLGEDFSVQSRTHRRQRAINLNMHRANINMMEVAVRLFGHAKESRSAPIVFLRCR